MKTKLLLTSLLISGVALTVGQTSHAADAQGLNKSGSANVEITAGSGTITPDPIEPFPPTGPMSPVDKLGITSATNLYFDSIALTSGTSTRDALYITKDKNGNEIPISNVAPENGTVPSVPNDGTAYVPGFSVTDRRGTGAGWNLKLSLGDFIQTNVAEGGTLHKLKGATLAFPSVTPLTSADASGSVAPTSLAKTIDAGGGAKVLMIAEKDTGMGIWEARYPSRAIMLSNAVTSEVNPIQLRVPGNNYAGQYTAKLTWDLSDVPATSDAE